MRLQDLIIGLIILALFMATILTFANRLNSDLEVTLDNETAEAFAAFNTSAESAQTNLYGVTIEMQNESIGGSNVQVDSSKTFNDNIIATGIRAVTTASRSFTVMFDMMTVLAKYVGVPPGFILAFFSILTVIIVMIFASSVLYNRL